MSSINQNDLLGQWFSKKESQEEPTKEAPTMGPLSHGQSRIYFLQKLNPNNPFYNYSEEIHIEGSLNIDQLVSSFGKVIERHPILRTVYLEVDGKIEQRVQEELPPQAKIFQVENLNEEQLLELKVDEASRPFDLEKGSPVRLSIFEKSSDIEMLLTIHHIAIDSWSMNILMKDWAALYQNNSLTGEQIPSSTYLEFVNKEKSVTPSTETLAYWDRKFEIIPENLELPLDYSRPIKASYKGGLASHKLKRETSDLVLQMCSQHQLRPFNLFLGLFNILLYKYTSSEAIVLGTAISKRNSTDLEETVGYFDDTLLLNNEIHPNQKVLDLLLATQKNTMDAFSHTDLSFEDLVKRLNIPRVEGLNPLFQMMFLYHQKDTGSAFSEHFNLTRQPFDFGVAKFDLSFHVVQNETQFDFIIDYSTDLYRRERIVQMLNHLEGLLEQIVQNPDGRIADLELLTAGERESILTWSEGPKKELPRETILDRISKHTHTSDASAYSGEILNWATVTQKAEDIAQHLLAKGLQPGQGVGLMVQPGHFLLQGILGILKAGGFYIPIDPEYPNERINYILNDSSAQWILTQHSLKDKLSDDHDIIAIEDVPGGENKLELPQVSPESTAYMIYTSGSTGQPKGVPITHGQLYNSTQARIHYYGEDVPRYLLMSSFSFDSSVAGIFWVILTGGCLITAPRRAEQNIEQLGQTIFETQATHTLMLPSLLKVVVEYIDTDKLASLKKVIVAGEACGHEVVTSFFDRIKGARLFNEYGPTEATVWSSVSEIKKETQKISIGSPILNTDCYVVRDDNRLAPMGHPGELLIGGKNVAQGYHQLPELTQDKFVHTPELFPGRLYRTGDLVYWNWDGELIFEGRKDRQVKLRGYRIELEAIQSALQSIEGVDQAICTIINEKNKKRLAAFWTGELKDHQDILPLLSGQLPRYMMPERWQHLGHFPRLPNGKINVKSLDDLLVTSTPDVTTSALAPQNNQEKLLAQIWAEVLGVESVSLRDNFFNLGGDSIQSIQVVALTRKAGFVLQPEDIFTYQTLQDLAAQMHALEESGISNDPIIGKAPFLPIHDWFFDLHHHAPQHWGQGYQLVFQEKQDPERLEEAFNTILQHHDGLRTQFYLGQRQFNIPVHEKRKIDQLSQGQTVSDYLNHWMSNSDVTQGHLFHLALDSEGKQVILSAHHLVVDAVSWTVIIGDLLELLADVETTMTSKTTSVLQWSTEINGLLGSPNPDSNEKNTICEKDLFQTSWRIPYGGIDFNSDGNAFGIRKEEWALMMTIILMQNILEEDRIHVDIENNGRQHPKFSLDLSRTVGWFTCMYIQDFPSLPTSSSVTDWIIEIKESYRKKKDNAVDHSLEYLKSNKPFGRVLFNYLGSELKGPQGVEMQFLTEGTRDENSERDFLLECNILDTGEGVQVNLSLPMDYKDRLNQNLLEENLVAVRNALMQSEQKYTPSDFEDVDLDQDDLDALMDQL